MTRKFLDVAIVALAMSLLLILALGGIDYDWGILRIRLHDWARPLALLAIALGARGALGATGAAGALAAASMYVTTRGLLSVILATAAIYTTYQVRVCGGLDSYGYVSTASLIASGHLSEPQPLVPLLPFEHASSAAAPLGYIAGVDGHTQVPRFPLGLPIVMALFKVPGASGPFYVPLVMAFVTIALAFLLASRAEARPHISPQMWGWPSGQRQVWGWPSGRRDIVAGLFAAALVAVDPLMVDYAIQPMSDVPAACWLLAAIWLRLDGGGSERTRPARGYVGRVLLDPAPLAGFCAGMAFLTRPALLLAAIAVGAVTMDRPARDNVKFAAALLVFVVLQMAINATLYGSVRLSGYGPASYMFEVSLSRLAANATNFGRWLTRSHTLLFWLLWPGALIVLRRSKWAWQISGVAAAAALPYLFYLVFDDWESSRFVLPAILLILILAARAMSVLLARRTAVLALAMLAVALAWAAASHRFLTQEDVYRLRDVEAKYALAGEWVRTHTPERAVVLAALHSGSMRFYGNRQTIRWDQIPSDKLALTLRNLEAAGYVPYLALDVPFEPPLFAERFGSEPKVRTEQIGRVRVVNIYRFVSAR